MTIDKKIGKTLFIAMCMAVLLSAYGYLASMAGHDHSNHNTSEHNHHNH